jgi:hypothetical protein
MIFHRHDGPSPLRVDIKLTSFYHMKGAAYPLISTLYWKANIIINEKFENNVLSIITKFKLKRILFGFATRIVKVKRAAIAQSV